MFALRVDETKVSSRKAFIGNLLELKSGEKSENNNSNFIREYPQIIDQCISLYPANSTYM